MLTQLRVRERFAARSSEHEVLCCCVDHAVLKAAPNDADVLKIKGVALLKQSDFAGALPCFADSPSTVLERAYCLYKLAKYPECLALLSTVPAASKTVGLSHLEAQVVRSVAVVCSGPSRLLTLRSCS